MTSSVIKWPDRRSVLDAVHRWASSEAKRHPDLIRLGYFGSYAKGDAGMGSDLDLVAVTGKADEPFERRNLSWDLLSLPVPAELLVYTVEEWQKLQQQETKFARMLREETLWVYEKALGS